MTGTQPDRPPIIAFLEALDARRNLAIGGAVGVLVAIAAYLFRVLELWGPFTGTRQYPVFGPEGWFLLLAFVLAVTSGSLVAIALTARSAVHRTREIADEDQ